MEDDGLPSHEEFLIDFDDLEFGKKIGRGQYGHVYKGEYLGTCVAIKQCVFEGQEQEMMQKYIAREISILKEVRHPNIVNFIGISKRIMASPRDKDKEVIYIVTEWVPHGNLHSYVKNKHNPLSWEMRVLMAVDVAASMAFLHQKNFIHRDLKSENLLVAENGRIKLCDFGFARFKSKGRLMTLAGTEQYMAPEVILGEDYGDKCDVFGFGVVLIELIARKSPPMRGPATCFDFRPEDVEAFFPADCPALLKELTIKCIKYSPADRPSFKEALVSLKKVRLQVNEDKKKDLAHAKEDRDIRRRSHAMSKPMSSPAVRERDRVLQAPVRGRATTEQEDDERGPEISFDDCERSADDVEDERGPEINFDDDERGPEVIEDERGPEICFDDERGPEIIEDERGPEICFDDDDEDESAKREREREDERGPEISFDEDVATHERTEDEREDERGPEISFASDDDDNNGRTEKKREDERGPEISIASSTADEEERRPGVDATIPPTKPGGKKKKKTKTKKEKNKKGDGEAAIWMKKKKKEKKNKKASEHDQVRVATQSSATSPGTQPLGITPVSPRSFKDDDPTSPRHRKDSWRYALQGQWSVKGQTLPETEADADAGATGGLVAHLEFRMPDPRRRDSLLSCAASPQTSE